MNVCEFDLFIIDDHGFDAAMVQGETGAGQDGVEFRKNRHSRLNTIRHRTNLTRDGSEDANDLSLFTSVENGEIVIHLIRLGGLHEDRLSRCRYAVDDAFNTSFRFNAQRQYESSVALCDEILLQQLLFTELLQHALKSNAKSSTELMDLSADIQQFPARIIAHIARIIDRIGDMFFQDTIFDKGLTERKHLLATSVTFSEERLQVPRCLESFEDLEHVRRREEVPFDAGA